MSDKNQTSSKHQKSKGEKKKHRTGWISYNSSTKYRLPKDLYARKHLTQEEYIEKKKKENLNVDQSN